MSDNSAIEWTDATWNPVTGCTKVSPGCDNCYAETFAERWRGTPGHYFKQGFDVVLRPDKLDQPLRWKRPRRIFVNSMSDLFHDSVPDEYIARVFAVMAQTSQHTYQLLTKRHGRMRSLLSSPVFQRQAFDAGTTPAGWDVRSRNDHRDQLAESWIRASWPLRNVWIGVSVEDQKRADLRVPALLDTPAAVRWLSCEPLLGPVNLQQVNRVDAPDGGWSAIAALGHGERPRIGVGIDWIVGGGESGPGARPMHPGWVRSLRDQCAAAGVPFFFKQWGEYVVRDQMTEDAFSRWDAKHGSDVYHESTQWRVGKKAAGRELDGRTWDEYPETAVVR